MTQYLRFFLFLIVLLPLGAISYSQEIALTPSQRVEAWMHEYIQAHPAAAKGVKAADSYERLLKITAAKRLGISLKDVDLNENPKISGSDEVEAINQEVNISKTSSYWQNETSVVISRANSSVIVAGANDQRMSYNGMPVYYSLDKGNSWKTTFIPFDVSADAPYGDPMLASGADGTLYYAYLSAEGFDETTSQPLDNIVVATSTDGVHWENQTSVLPLDQLSGLEDKEQIWVDLSPTSPTYGRVYICWVHFNDDFVSGEMRIVFSDDKCKTWSEPKVIEESIGRFSQVRTGKNGELFVSFSNEDDMEHRIYSSTDGINFVYHGIADYELPPINFDGRPSLKGDYGFRCYPFSTFDIDLKNNVIHVVYSTWYDDGSSMTLYYTRSSDLGKTWTTAMPVGYQNTTLSGETARDRFDPWLTIRQATGDVYLTYYSSERDPDNLKISAHCVKLYDGDDSHEQQVTPLETTDFDGTKVKISSSSTSTSFIGDYIGADVFDTLYAGVWTRSFNANSRDGEVYAYVGSVNSMAAAVSSAPVIIHSDELRVSSVFPNPISAGSAIEVRYYSPVMEKATCSLYSVTGVKIADLWTGTLSDGANSIRLSTPAISSGSYLLRLETAAGSDQQTVVIR